MRSHIHLLGILQLVWGGMGLLLALSLLLLAAGAVAIAQTTAGDPMPAGFTALLFAVFAVAIGAGGWASAWVGRSIRRHRAQGRIVAFVLAVPNLFVLPYGTALAIYTFWVLLHDESRALFEPPAPTA
jgi:hypothetical protein